MSESSISAPKRTFHLFPRLPAELRLAIWRECLPHRVSELDSPLDFVAFGLMPRLKVASPCKLWRTTYINGLPPVITRVCRESRSVAFETGSISGYDDMPPEAQWSAGNSVGFPWSDTVRDSVHLNWTPAYEPDYISNGSPLHCLAWDAARVPGGGSLMIDYLCPDFGCSISKKIDIIKLLPSWVVVTRVVVMHADPRTGAKTCPFGLLGDAPVQLVDVSDKLVRIFHRDSAESIKQKLRDIIIETFGSEELLPPMHPAIMFRLCTEMCNHSGIAKKRFVAKVNEDEDEDEDEP